MNKISDFELRYRYKIWKNKTKKKQNTGRVLMGQGNIKHTEVDWCIYTVYAYVHFCINYTYIKWLTWQPDWSKKCVPCQSGVRWDSVRFCHATLRVTLFSQMYPQLIWSHRSCCISFPASGQSSTSCSLWSWGYLSCDVITWRSSLWQYQCKINPPRHGITSAGSALTSPACLCDPEASCAATATTWCQMLDSRRPRVAPSEARSLGSLALRVREDVVFITQTVVIVVIINCGNYTFGSQIPCVINSAFPSQ